MEFITTEMAKLRPKLLRANPAQGRNSCVGSIKQAMKQMSVTNEEYYPGSRPEIKSGTILSLTELFQGFEASLHNGEGRCPQRAVKVTSAATPAASS